MSSSNLKIRAYLFPLLLILSIISGGVTGLTYSQSAIWLKPVGDIFLNLMLTAIVPLVFFSVSAAVARVGASQQLGRIITAMLLVFIFTGVAAALFMLAVTSIFPPAQNIYIPLPAQASTETVSLSSQLAGILTVTEFSKLLSHNSMLPLIFFAMLTGTAVSASGEQGRPFANFLQAGAAVFLRLITIVMYFAPLGFFAWFAVLAAQFGPELLHNYVRVTVIYYVFATIYFLAGFTVYAWLADRLSGVKTYWKNQLLPALTSLATCSSAASIPANMQAAKDMGVKPDVFETVIPLGAIVHKDGSVLGAVIKIAFLFGIFHMSFSGAGVMLTAVIAAVLAGTVMGAIPGGGMLGEMLILGIYGFPAQALIMIAAISVIIDPLATMLNVTGDTVCSMLVERLVKPEQACASCPES